MLLAAHAHVSAPKQLQPKVARQVRKNVVEGHSSGFEEVGDKAVVARTFRAHELLHDPSQRHGSDVR
eukprot:2661772-Rhodomonas_salina.1